MERIFRHTCSMVLLATALASCSNDTLDFTDNDYVMFADTLVVLPIEDSSERFEIVVGASKTYKYDRNFGVEVLVQESSAIQGVHYVLESNTATIKAGELTGSIVLRGICDNMEIDGNVTVKLRLLTNMSTTADAYEAASHRASVVLQKACAFDLNRFTGYYTLVSTYFGEYMVQTQMLLSTAQIDPTQKNTIVLRDFYYKGYDIRLSLDSSNKLTPNLYSNNAQQIGSTAEAFGTIYGNGKLMMYLPAAYTSYFSNCEEFMTIYNTLYVENVGTVGTFVNIVKFITDEEAEAYKRVGY